MSFSPGAYSRVDGSEQTIASVPPDAMQENRPAEVSFGANHSLGGMSNDHSPQAYQPPGKLASAVLQAICDDSWDEGWENVFGGGDRSHMYWTVQMRDGTGVLGS